MAQDQRAITRRTPETMCACGAREGGPGAGRDGDRRQGLLSGDARGRRAPDPRILNVWPAEKLYVNPDCGFGWSPRGMCNGKIAALAGGIRIVREELSGA